MVIEAALDGFIIFSFNNTNTRYFTKTRFGCVENIVQSTRFERQFTFFFDKAQIFRLSALRFLLV